MCIMNDAQQRLVHVIEKCFKITSSILDKFRTH